jgi:hypothetical protein
MSVLGRLASALERNDERPNVELAEDLAASGDRAAIAELVAALSGGTTAVQNDAIKVLYEIGARNPELVTGYAGAFLALLNSRNNRNVWGALQALESIAAAVPDELAGSLDAILLAADKGSVIAKDKAMQILATLAAKGHAKRAVPALLTRLEDAAPNQFPMYAEVAAPAIGPSHRVAFREILEGRLKTIPQPAKRKRVEKVLKALG